MANKIAVVVGHTKRAPGAALAGSSNIHEYQWNSDLAARMKQRAQDSRGIELDVFTRDRGGLESAYDSVRAWGADCAIELHFNAAGATATGTETLYYTAPSGPFARQVHQAIQQCLGLRDRGVKTPQEASGGRGERNLKQMGAKPSILLEPFFGSNLQDAATAEAKKHDLAGAIVDAAVQYLKRPFDNNDEAEWVVSASVLNVRGGPGTDYEKLSWGPLLQGSKVALIKRYGEWFHVEAANGNQGFVHSAFLA